MLFLIASFCHAADEPLVLEEEGASVSFLPGDAGLARETLSTLNDAATRIQSQLGITFNRAIKITIVRDRVDFNRAVGEVMPEWAMAAAVPPNTIVVDALKVTAGTESNMRLTFIHEAAHLALGQVERADAPLPRWFHEGVATWVSGAEHFTVDWGAYDLAVAQNALPPLNTIEENFPAGAVEANVAYLESETFIRYVVRTRGQSVVRWILEQYRGGRDFHSAFREALGEPVETVEKEWRGSIHKSFPWLRAIVGTLSFWSIMALVTIIAFLLLRWRARRQREEWDREEAWRIVNEDEDEEDEPVEDVYKGEAWEEEDEE